MTLKKKLLKGINSASITSIGRYAPSPTGPMHMGNIQTALLAWLQIRLRGGRIFLRIDDLDTFRIKASSTKQIMDDLAWLGFDWDGDPYYQSEHLHDYETAFKRLRNDQEIYPCRCTRSEIMNLASAPHILGSTTKYPGTCRTRMIDVETEQSVVAWRFRVRDERIQFDDLIAGTFSQNLETQIGDFILKRKDGVFAYQLATVVDDGLLGVTDVLRGEDLLDSTPRQIAILTALGQPIPRFWHVPLKLAETGERLAKRNGDVSLSLLREQGLTPNQVIGKLSFELNLIGENKPLSLDSLKQALLSQ